MRVIPGLISVVMLGLLGCNPPPTVDDQAQVHGDPGTSAWQCGGEDLDWDPMTEFPAGTKWGGTCSSTWSCANGTFVVTCTGGSEGYWQCSCDTNGSAGPTFNASGYCDMTEADRARRGNVGCGWKLPVQD